jgi:hypothetical protein
MNRILLISMSRSGTSHLSNEIMKKFENENNDYIWLNQELLFSSHWHDTSSHIHKKLKLQINAHGYDFDSIIKSNNAIKKTILDILRKKDQYVIKYSGGDSEDFFSNREMIELVKELKLKIVFLYRENIIDKVQSHIIIENYGYLDDPVNIKFNKHFCYTPQTISTAIWGYKSFDSLYKTFNQIDNSCILKYSDLTFDGTDHHNVIKSDFVIPPSTKKIVNNEVKFNLNSKIPNLTQEVLEFLKNTSLAYDHNLNYILPNQSR